MSVKECFAERLLKLRCEKRPNMSRQKVADDLGISRASLEYYEKGERSPDVEVLSKIVDYYGVSADYILGRTDNQTTDAELISVCEYTGLTEGAVKRIKAELKDGPTPYTAFTKLNTFSPMLQSDEFWNLAALIENYNEDAPDACYLDVVVDALSEIIASDFNFYDKHVLLELIDELFALDNKTIRTNANYLMATGLACAKDRELFDDGIFPGSLPFDLAAEAADRLAIIEYRAAQKLMSLVKKITANSDMKAFQAYNNEWLSDVLEKRSDISPGFADFVRNKLHEALLKAGE